MKSFLSLEQVQEIIAKQRDRGSYAQYMYDEFGIKMPKYVPPTRRQKLRGTLLDWKNRGRKICQIIWRGYCDEEVEW